MFTNENSIKNIRFPFLNNLPNFGVQLTTNFGNSENHQIILRKK